jgi:hypothetical protein
MIYYDQRCHPSQEKAKVAVGMTIIIDPVELVVEYERFEIPRNCT